MKRSTEFLDFRPAAVPVTDQEGIDERRFAFFRP